jgi:hypothetical protein
MFHAVGMIGVQQQRDHDLGVGTVDLPCDAGGLVLVHCAHRQAGASPTGHACPAPPIEAPTTGTAFQPGEHLVLAPRDGTGTNADSFRKAVLLDCELQPVPPGTESQVRVQESMEGRRFQERGDGTSPRFGYVLFLFHAREAGMRARGGGN